MAVVPEVAASSLPSTGLVLKKEPSLTYKLDAQGMVDGLDAIKQAILLILSIERYDWAIYSPDYGIELKDLYGRSPYFVYPELKRRITEALTQDDRILTVRDFSYEIQGSKISVTFSVDTDSGALNDFTVEADIAA